MKQFEKYRKYKNMLEDGVLSQQEFEKLESILINDAINEGAIDSKEQFGDALNDSYYKEAIRLMSNHVLADHQAAITIFDQLGEWRESLRLSEKCKSELPDLESQAQILMIEQQKEETYKSVKSLLDDDTLESYEQALVKLQEISGWRDAEDLIDKCNKRIDAIRTEREIEKQQKEEAARIEKERKNEERLLAFAKRKRVIKKLALALSVLLILGVSAGLLVTRVIIPAQDYKAAQELFEAGNYEDAIIAFQALGDYKDSEAKVEEARHALLEHKYAAANALFKAGEFSEAKEAYEDLGEYKDSKSRAKEAADALNELDYLAADELLKAGKYEDAVIAFSQLGDYKDSKSKAQQARKECSADKTPNLGIVFIDGPETQEQAESQDAWVDGFDLQDGLYVIDITNRSLIEGGLQLGDRIITLNGETIQTEEDLQRVVKMFQPGDDATVVVSRESEEVTVEGVFVLPFELLPEKQSGNEVFNIDGRKFRITYSEDSWGISIWRNQGE